MSQADERSERSLIDAVLGGDRDAYRHLVDRESASVLRASHRVVGDLHEAEDVAQEAFVTAYRSLASWRGDGPFGAWLTRIAVRIALRRVGQRRSVTWLDTSSDGGSDERTIATTLRTGPAWDPAAHAVRVERAADLRAAVAGLPEPYREVRPRSRRRSAIQRQPRSRRAFHGRPARHDPPRRRNPARRRIRRRRRTAATTTVAAAAEDPAPARDRTRRLRAGTLTR